MTVPILRTVDELRSYLQETHQQDFFKDAPPIDVDGIARYLNIQVSEELRLDSDDINVVGRITLSGENGQATVWINPMENSYAPRRRFTLAHEIAHFCMHRSDQPLTFVDTKGTMNRTTSYWDTYESEANNFAAELLMPEQLIRSVGKEVISVYKEETGAEKMPMSEFSLRMAGRFKVSNPAMEYRLKNIGIKGS